MKLIQTQTWKWYIIVAKEMEQSTAQNVDAISLN